MAPGPYAMKVVTTDPLDKVELRVREELARDGFGILTEIDVQATLKKKIDLDRPPYRILGACNPKLAARGLAAEPELGVLLPCNVCLWVDGRNTVVAAMKPTAALALTSSPVVHGLAEEAERLVWGALLRAVPRPLEVEGGATS